MDLSDTAETTVVNIAVITKATVSVSSLLIWVWYCQYIVYGRADRKVNDGIALNKSHFSKSTSQKPSKYRANSSYGWQRSLPEQLEC